MGFTETIGTVFSQNYAQFSGRASRAEFWWFTLFYTLTLGLFGLLIGLSIGFSVRQPGLSDIPSVTVALLILAVLFVLACLLPAIALAVRRLHDRDLSGWWYLLAVLASLLPVVGWLASIALLVVCALPGSPGPNRFGPPPGTGLGGSAGGMRVFD